jgi:DNA-binding NarL/FixJ family response regulator
VLRGEVAAPAHTERKGDADAEAALEVAERVAQLTPQQFRVFGMLCSGRLNKQIGDTLQITEATVKAHMTVILRKLGAANRTQAVLLAGLLGNGSSEIKPLPEGVE